MYKGFLIQRFVSQTTDFPAVSESFQLFTRSEEEYVTCEADLVEYK